MTKKPSIAVSRHGPLVVSGMPDVRTPTGRSVKTARLTALCRCGLSAERPFCDGAHGKASWTDEKREGRQPNRVDDYVGKSLVIHDNRGVCSHAGHCTSGLPGVWRMTQEPWIDPDGASVEEIIKVIEKCPSGALSYTIDGKLHNALDSEPGITVTKDGPLQVIGGCKLATRDGEEPHSPEHYALCRCGQSKNKPFCDGAHWYASFADDGERQVAPAREQVLAAGPFELVEGLAQSGRSEITSMRTRRKFPEWDTILFKGAQLFRQPLNEDEAVNTKTIIGRTAKHALELAMPFYVSHMSFGALSREAKIALARGASIVGTMMCSGEGGMLPEEREESTKYVYELGTACLSHREEAIRQADATEIKIGQAAKPGMGGHLPKEKITPEIAKLRGIGEGEDSISPGRHADIDSVEDLKREVDHLRELTGGKPVGIKFAAGHVEQDVAIALEAGPDFITVDCRGGATGAAPTFLKDNVGVPPIYAIRRARKALDAAKSEVTLCVTGGFRTSSDIAKALALGADAVALATASMVAIGCRQARICETGRCPVGIATQDPGLRSLLDSDHAIERFVRFFEGTNSELANWARVNGRADVHELDVSDLLTLDDDVARHAGVDHG